MLVLILTLILVLMLMLILVLMLMLMLMLVLILILADQVAGLALSLKSYTALMRLGLSEQRHPQVLSLLVRARAKEVLNARISISISTSISTKEVPSLLHAL